MTRRRIEIKIGDVYAGRVAISETYAVPDSNERRFNVRCDKCGRETAIPVSGRVYRCTCHQNRYSGELLALSRSRIHIVWMGMIGRCDPAKAHYWKNNPEHYANYGGRGIRVCDAWHDFGAFVEWALSNGYADDLEIDREDVNGNYCPENCRFITQIMNARNKRSTRFLTAWGETKAIPDWGDDPRAVVPYRIIGSRVRTGWSPEEAIATPKGAPRR